MPNMLLFRCDSTRYALEAEAVDVIHWRPALSPLDGMPDWFAGLLNLHGEPIPVIDLAPFMGHDRPAPDPTQQLIVLRQAQRRAALIVDQVEALEIFSESAIQPFSQATGEEQKGPPVIRGELNREDALIMWLDPAALMAAIPQQPRQPMPHPPVPGRPDDLHEATLASLFSERMHRLAEAPMARRDEHPHSFAIILTGERRFAIELEKVVEFGRLRHVAVIPQSPRMVIGCINLRGEIITVIDLNPLIDGSEGADECQVVILFLEGEKFALRIGAVERLVQVDAEGIIPLNEVLDAHPMARVMLRGDNELTAVLDGETLLARLLE